VVGGGEKEPEKGALQISGKLKESSSGETGNCAGRTRGEPKVASAGDKLDFSCGVERKEKRNHGRWPTQSSMVQHARSVSLRRW
jgi:hypothetical protein